MKLDLTPQCVDACFLALQLMQASAQNALRELQQAVAVVPQNVPGGVPLETTADSGPAPAATDGGAIPAAQP